MQFPDIYLSAKAHMAKWLRSFPVAALLIVLAKACSSPETGKSVEIELDSALYEVKELSVQSSVEYEDPYLEVEWGLWLYGPSGDSTFYPGFWDGGNTYRVRIAMLDTARKYRFRSVANVQDSGLHSLAGSIQGIASPSGKTNGLLSKGPIRVHSEDPRFLQHADGSIYFMIGDTPWAIPFRARPAEVREYTSLRKQQGFNAALLMSLQPDRLAEGPDARGVDQGFARAFDSLSNGKLQGLRISYFQTLDTLVALLREADIVPVLQPVFHGYGWKGLDVLGTSVDADEYVRYVRYLHARYGAAPAIWLLGADNGGKDPGVSEAGEWLFNHDPYRQARGLHYSPCDTFIATWAVGNPSKHCMHFDSTSQSSEWLNFQWAQTGHDGQHNYRKVSRMATYRPIKAIANGEPTYEGMSGGKNGLGDWQAEEAFGNFFAGPAMGVFYGANGLWQWKVSPDETGWPEWTDQPMSWREAMRMPGAEAFAKAAKVLGPLALPGIQRLEHQDFSSALLQVPGRYSAGILKPGVESLDLSSQGKGGLAKVYALNGDLQKEIQVADGLLDGLSAPNAQVLIVNWLP